jgi:hypothetical protein
MNKHFCQGPHCHTNPTTDRFLKSKGIIRGRYAYSRIDDTRYYSESDKYFCSQTCKLQWLNENMQNIERGIPVPFITHRRISEGYEKATEDCGFGRSYKTIRKIPVDNDNENDRIIL